MIVCRMLLVVSAVAACATPASLYAELPAAAVHREVRFEPVGDESQISEMFRLASHTFVAVQSPMPSSSRAIDVFEVTFPSPLTTPFECNNTVHCEYFRPQAEGRRPAVVVLHILGGDFTLSRLFCRYLAHHGTAALFVKMPYYGPRRPTNVHKSMVSVDPRETVEGMRQAVLDIRRAGAFLASLEEVDPRQIGIFGISLGGITSALAAEQEPRFANVCLMLAGGDIGKITWESNHIRRVRDQWLAAGHTQEEFFNVVRPIDPVTHAARLRDRRMLMINAAHDEVIPPVCTESLWQGAGKPPIIWYDAGHYSAIKHLFDGIGEVTRFFCPDLRPSTPASN